MSFIIQHVKDLYNANDFGEYGVFSNVCVENTNWLVVEGERVILPNVQHNIKMIEEKSNTNCNKLTPGELVNISGWDTMARHKINCGFMLGGHDNYYHFLVQYLANYKVFEQIIKSANVSILVDETFHWQSQLLDIFGVDRERRISINEPAIFEVSSLLYPRSRADFEGRVTDHDLGSWLRQKVRLGNPHGVKRANLYISRNRYEKRTQRRIANETELEEFFGDFKFRKMFPEMLSVADQINEFIAADFVVGPTGTGLSNIAFSQTGTKLFELMPAHTWRPPQINFLCRGVGIDNTQILCEGAFESEYMHVDIDRLARAFDVKDVKRRSP